MKLETRKKSQLKGNALVIECPICHDLTNERQVTSRAQFHAHDNCILNVCKKWGEQIETIGTPCKYEPILIELNLLQGVNIGATIYGNEQNNFRYLYCRDSGNGRFKASANCNSLRSITRFLQNCIADSVNGATVNYIYKGVIYKAPFTNSSDFTEIADLIREIDKKANT